MPDVPPSDRAGGASEVSGAERATGGRDARRHNFPVDLFTNRPLAIALRASRPQGVDEGL